MAAHLRRRTAPPSLPRMMRFCCAALLITGGVVTWLLRQPYRSGEAVASAWVADHLLSARVTSYPKLAFVIVGPPNHTTFMITPACSSMLIVVIFFLGSALLAVAAPRFRVRRIFTAFAIAVALAVAVNVARVILIVLTTSDLGEEIGFRLGHEYLGSILTVFGMALALLAYLVLLARDRSPVRTP